MRAPWGLVPVAAMTLLAPSPAASAQVEEGEYRGRVTSMGGEAPSGALPAEVVLDVAAGSVRGRLTAAVEVAGFSDTPGCFRFSIDLADAPLALGGDGAAGEVPATFDDADGGCAAGSAFANAETVPGTFDVTFDGNRATGSVVFAFGEDDQFVVTFEASRDGDPAGATTTTTECPPGLRAQACDTSTTVPDDQAVLAGIEEFLVGDAAVSRTSMDELIALTGCRDRDRSDEVRQRCERSFVAGRDFSEAMRARFGTPVDNPTPAQARAIQVRAELTHLVTVALLTDRDGRPVAPLVARMWPVITLLAARGLGLPPDQGGDDALRAMRRLAGLMIVLDLGSRG